MRKTGVQTGYSLVELMLATAIMLGVIGTIFSLVNPSQGAFRAQPEVADVQQRMRVAAAALFADLVMAGAGPDGGERAGALIDAVAPIRPYRTGLVDSDPAAGVFFRPDTITVMYVPNVAPQAPLSGKMVNPSADLDLEAAPGCPRNDRLCGFREGQALLIFDGTGVMDTFTSTGVESDSLSLQHRNQVFSKSYGEGAVVTAVEHVTYYRDATTDELRRYDGARSDLPLVDHVVGLGFRYFGDPNPPRSPEPDFGAENCLFDSAGNPRLPTLMPMSVSAGSLVELTGSMLRDGPWCGSGDGRFDADLYRVRKLRVELRLGAAASDLRGDDPALFVRPGASSRGAGLVPDYAMSFDVTPPNMNLMR